VIDPTQAPVPDDTQQSQETDVITLGGIRTTNPIKLAAADPRLIDRAATGVGLCAVKIQSHAARHTVHTPQPETHAATTLQNL
jgi:hypothetical protein